MSCPFPLRSRGPASFGDRIKNFQYDLVAFFDRAFVLTKQNPDESVLNYAIARTNGIIVDSDSWPLFQHLLCQCVRVEPNTVIPTIEQLLRYEGADYEMNTELIAEVMNKQIQCHAPLGHNSEVAWSLWALIKFKCRISDPTAKVLGNLDDPIAALLSLDALARGLMPRTLSIAKWSSCMTTPDLYGRNWILSYEGNVKGWLKSVSTPDHVADEPNFSLLKKWGVSFYDTTKIHGFTPISVGEDYLDISF